MITGPCASHPHSQSEDAVASSMLTCSFSANASSAGPISVEEWRLWAEQAGQETEGGVWTLTTGEDGTLEEAHARSDRPKDVFA